MSQRSALARAPRVAEAAKSALLDVRCLGSQLSVRVPRPGYRPAFAGAAGDLAANALQELRREGIVLLPAYFTGELLESLQTAFDELMAELPPSTENPDSFHTEDFFAADESFLRAALDDTVLTVVGGYYRRPFFLGRADATRILPTEPHRQGSFQWHHDTRARQPKAMVLLREVGSDGQRMRYVRRSHVRLYRHARMFGPGSRFEEDFVARPVRDEDIVDVVGPAGTVAIFDTNGLHTGTRGRAPTRDTLICYYTTGRNVRRMRFLREQVESLPPEKRAVVTANPLHELV